MSEVSLLPIPIISDLRLPPKDRRARCGHLIPTVCRQRMNREAQPLIATQKGRKRTASSLLLSGSSNSSADVHDGGSHNPPSDMFMADTAANSHIIDSDDMASGGNGTGSHSEAQDGTDGGRVTPGIGSAGREVQGAVLSGTQLSWGD